ncbi:hypothetical protein HPB50_019731 [Hyalomma asiaticum]|uniref:Uncharacterized protein n=1 Tax=Hyalomma asiaticum TaxID=266040 RepID=A0ACB7S8I9_HYAAI|nr:hypothetical protein HPB50_019731 [Hyalomma asiaticum]
MNPLQYTHVRLGRSRAESGADLFDKAQANPPPPPPEPGAPGAGFPVCGRLQRVAEARNVRACGPVPVAVQPAATASTTAASGVPSPLALRLALALQRRRRLAAGTAAPYLGVGLPEQATAAAAAVTEATARASHSPIGGGHHYGGHHDHAVSPMGVIKNLLLPFLPKPKVNLNGRVVFGVVLEKGVGLGHNQHGQQHHHAVAYHHLVNDDPVCFHSLAPTTHLDKRWHAVRKHRPPTLHVTLPYRTDYVFRVGPHRKGLQLDAKHARTQC